MVDIPIPGPKTLTRLKEIANPASARRKGFFSNISLFSGEQLFEVVRLLAAGVSRNKIARHIQQRMGLCGGSKEKTVEAMVRKFHDRVTEHMPEMLTAQVTHIESIQRQIVTIDQIDQPFDALAENRKLIRDVQHEIDYWTMIHRENGVAPYDYVAKLYALLGERISADVKLRQGLAEFEEYRETGQLPRGKGAVGGDQFLVILQEAGGEKVQQTISAAQRKLRAVAQRALTDGSE